MVDTNEQRSKCQWLCSQPCNCLWPQGVEHHLCLFSSSGWNPWVFLTLWVIRHCFPAFCCYCLSIWSENHKRRYALHLILLAQHFFHISFLERQRYPRHLSKVIIEGRLILIGRHEDDFHTQAREGLLVHLGQFRSEATTWWAPMC